MEAEVIEAVLEKRARNLDRRPVSAPLIGTELDSENRASLRLTRPAQPGTSAQSPCPPLENADLDIQARLLALPGYEKIEKVVNLPLVRLAEIVEAPVPRIHLAGQERGPVFLQEIAQREAGGCGEAWPSLG
jgi:hypothetical protein